VLLPINGTGYAKFKKGGENRMDNEFLSIFEQVTDLQASGNTIESAQCPQQEDTTCKKTMDPRTDLMSDSCLWEKIFWNADQISPGLFGSLHFLRCGGARIETTQTSFKLLPGAEEWILPKMWSEQKAKVLDPIRGELIRLFQITRLGLIQDAPPDIDSIFPKPSTQPDYKQEVLPGCQQAIKSHHP
jgi:hypothetical protein